MHSHANKHMLSLTCKSTLTHRHADEHACIQKTFRYKHPPMNKSDLHIRTATMAQKTCSYTQLYTKQLMCFHQQPFTTHTHVLAYTHSFTYKHVHVCTLSYGFVAHTQASRHIQTHVLQPTEYTHKDPHMHTHIYLNEGFGLGNSFSRNRNNCQKE